MLRASGFDPGRPGAGHLPTAVPNGGPALGAPILPVLGRSFAAATPSAGTYTPRVQHALFIRLAIRVLAALQGMPRRNGLWYFLLGACCGSIGTALLFMTYGCGHGP